MGQFLDLPAINAGLKEWYNGQTVENLAGDDNPGLVMIPKKTNATGKYVPIPIIYEVSPGSANFTNAQQNQAPMQLAEFLLPLKPDYALATIANQAMEASGDEAGSFLDFAKEYINVAIQSCASSAASGAYRPGTGTVGQISSIANGVITLTNAADIQQFGINWTLQANTVDGGSPRAALGYVVARNVTAGTITVSPTGLQGAAGTPSGWSNADFLLVQGNNNAKISGFPAWIPSVAPGPTDNFYGVNRSVDSRLYGLYYAGQQQPIEEALIDAAMLVRREKGRPRHFFTNYGSEAALIKALGTRREYVDYDMDGVVGFRGTKIQGPAGPIEIFADRNCQAATGYLLQLNTWTFYSLGAVPKIIRYGDNLEMLRLANGDASEVRVGYYGNIGCNAPGWSSQVALGV